MRSFFLLYRLHNLIGRGHEAVAGKRWAIFTQRPRSTSSCGWESFNRTRTSGRGVASMLAAYPHFYGWKDITSVIVYPDDGMGPVICWVLKGTRPLSVPSKAKKSSDKCITSSASAIKHSSTISRRGLLCEALFGSCRQSRSEVRPAWKRAHKNEPNLPWENGETWTRSEWQNIRRSLGQGAFGQVFAVCNVHTGELLAMKRIHMSRPGSYSWEQIRRTPG